MRAQPLYRTLTGASLAVLLMAPLAAEQPAHTGSHLESRTARPMSLQLNESSEVTEIQRLLSEGETEAAVRRARRYVDSFKLRLHVSYDEMMPARYFALNALCVALTQFGDTEGAATACTEAIGMIPDRWSAINNRGTARFVAGRYGEALADYRLALRVAPPERGIVETIEHNINLTVQSQQENSLFLEP